MDELDLRDVTCPLTWVRTKLALEAMSTGDELRVRLGSPEARENVPRSAREAGHEVSAMGEAILIRKAG